MTVLNFYFTDIQSWIEYEENGVVNRQDFATAEETTAFIEQNDLPLTYLGCCKRD